MNRIKYDTKREKYSPPKNQSGGAIREFYTNDEKKDNNKDNSKDNSKESKDGKTIVYRLKIDLDRLLNYDD